MDCLGASNFATMAVSPAWRSRRRFPQKSKHFSISNGGFGSFRVRVRAVRSGGSEGCVATKEQFADEEDYIKAGGSEILFVQMQQNKDMDKQSKLADKVQFLFPEIYLF